MCLTDCPSSGAADSPVWSLPSDLDGPVRRRTIRAVRIGTYEQLREEFAALERLGITRFYLQGGYDPDRTPELLEAVIASSH